MLVEVALIFGLYTNSIMRLRSRLKRSSALTSMTLYPKPSSISFSNWPSPLGIIFAPFMVNKAIFGARPRTSTSAVFTNSPFFGVSTSTSVPKKRSWVLKRAYTKVMIIKIPKPVTLIVLPAFMFQFDFFEYYQIPRHTRLSYFFLQTLRALWHPNLDLPLRVLQAYPRDELPGHNPLLICVAEG